MKKAKTPEQLASEPPKKSQYSLYLNTANMEYLKARAAKAQGGKRVSASELVDLAIEVYIEQISKKKD